MNAIRFNLKTVRKMIGKSELWFVVKADAYNHGAAVTALATEDLIDGFAVATVEEASELRRAGVSAPITALMFDPSDIDEGERLAVIPLIGSLADLERLGERNIPIDLKIDSGMNRSGLKYPSEIQAALEIIKSRHLSLRGLATHFFSTESIARQKARFYALAEPLTKEFPTVKVSLSATSGILSGEYADGVRAGLIAYGYGADCLMPALTVTSTLIGIKTLAAGESLGYDGTYKAERAVRTGFISGGYAEGVKRAYKGAYVFVGGKRAEIIGNVCMDGAFISLDGIAAEPGDIVTVAEGKNMGALATSADTIIYEVLTGFRGRVKRCYYR